MCIEDRTTKALGQQVIGKLRSLEFCVVGCGGTGAGFAEMLVRSGAKRLILIDGDRVKPSDLNRTTAFGRGRRVRDAVHDTDVVFIGTDTNSSRLAIERLIRCRPSDRPAMYLSCGIHVDRASGSYYFECNWSPKTPEERADDEGYGPENASYAAIVLEATAVCFSMLLSHLISNDSSFRSYSRRYDATLTPVEPS